MTSSQHSANVQQTAHALCTEYLYEQHTPAYLFLSILHVLVTLICCNCMQLEVMHNFGLWSVPDRYFDTAC